ncbi:hypothetical protein CK203_023615 [Vitis vinifera]|uniref:Uncharacterized protein n=1 Tax=Vitis vinifera TaxID=29760 RepID=A0A438JC62_VITVI|nr:hypothetical protein CK203_023615 [Vitis vinifera]
MSLPCGPAPEANLSAQKNHVLMEDSMALSDDAGKVQLVPGSSSSPPSPTKPRGFKLSRIQVILFIGRRVIRNQTE